MTSSAFHIVAGPAAGTTFSIGSELVVGRDSQPPGDLGGDGALSRRHARIFRTAGDAVAIEDLGSHNGTFVNGVRIGSAQILRAGDRILVGTSHCEVIADAPGPAPAPHPSPAATSSPTPSPTRRSRNSVLAGALVIAGLLVGGGLFLARRSSGGGATSDATPFDGTVYVESNRATDNGNSILAMRYDNGSLAPLRITEYPTGGRGSADLTDSGVLDADQQVVIDVRRKLLLAVNQGSDTVAVLRIAPDGALSPVTGSPFPSGGKAPASLGLHGDQLIVVNKAQDGVRNLKKDAPNYTSFRLGADGKLTPTGSTVEIDPGSSPTQALITNTDDVMVSTEEAGPLRAFAIGKDGTLKPGPNSPLPVAASLYPADFPKEKQWALGLGAHPRKPIVYAELATINKMGVYTYRPSGELMFVRAVDNRDSVLPCWTLLNADGTRIYTANAASDNISVFDIKTDPLRPTQLQTIKLNGPGNPWNLALSPDGKFLFVLNPRARSEDVKPGEGNTLHTLKVGADGTLEELAGSPIALPLPLGTNPFGIAVSSNG